MAEPRLCSSCGKPLKEGGEFCIYCGAKNAPEAPQAEAHAPSVPRPMDDETMRMIFGTEPEHPATGAPEEEAPFAPPRSVEYRRLMEQTYAPMGAWNVCGTLLLFCLPVIGLVFAIIFACGGCRKRQKKRLAQGYLLFLILSILLFTALCAVLFLFFWQPVLDVIRQAVPAETWTYLCSVLPFLTA